MTAGQRRPDSGPHFQLYRADASAPVRWRLLGGNNRTLGQGVQDYPDVASCHSAVMSLGEILHELTGQVSRLSPSMWVWRVRHEEVELVASPHSYDRQIRSVHGMSQFLLRAGQARIDEVVMLSAARRWRPGSDAGPHRNPHDASPIAWRGGEAGAPDARSVSRASSVRTTRCSP